MTARTVHPASDELKNRIAPLAHFTTLVRTQIIRNDGKFRNASPGSADAVAFLGNRFG
jgi:hypothetical protein